MVLCWDSVGVLCRYSVEILLVFSWYSVDIPLVFWWVVVGVVGGPAQLSSNQTQLLRDPTPLPLHSTDDQV